MLFNYVWIIVLKLIFILCLIYHILLMKVIIKLCLQYLMIIDFYADQYKIYPTMVTENTEIKKWYDEGTYKPNYESKEGIEKLIQLCIFLKKILKEIKELIV